MNCPNSNCHEGKILSLAAGFESTCPICKGRGEIPDEIPFTLDLAEAAFNHVHAPRLNTHNFNTWDKRGAEDKARWRAMADAIVRAYQRGAK